MPDARRDSGLKWKRGSDHFEWLEAAWHQYTASFHTGLAALAAITDTNEPSFGRDVQTAI